MKYIQVTLSRKLGFALLIVVAAASVFVLRRYPGRATVLLPDSACNASLWQRTYENQRLEMITPCTAVQGHVVSVHKQRRR